MQITFDPSNSDDRALIASLFAGQLAAVEAKSEAPKAAETAGALTPNPTEAPKRTRRTREQIAEDEVAATAKAAEARALARTEPAKQAEPPAKPAETPKEPTEEMLQMMADSKPAAKQEETPKADTPKADISLDDLFGAPEAKPEPAADAVPLLTEDELRGRLIGCARDLLAVGVNDPQAAIKQVMKDFGGTDTLKAIPGEKRHAVAVAAGALVAEKRKAFVA